MDKRILKTKKTVFQSFAELLECVPYSQITVQSILDASGIGRGTFYAHFQSKDDLLRSFCSDMLFGTFEEFPQETYKIRSVSEKEPIYNRIVLILKRIQSKRSEFLTALSNECGRNIRDCIRENLKQAFMPFIEEAEFGIPASYLLNNLAGGFSECIFWWSEHPEYSPEEIAEFCLKAAPYLCYGCSALSEKSET